MEIGVQGGEVGDALYMDKVGYLLKTAPAYEKYEKAKLCLKEKNTKEAISLVNQALKIEPDEALFYGLRGDAYFMQKKYDRAIMQYDHAINLNDRYFYFFEKRGLAFRQLGNETRAKEDLLSGVDLLPTATSYNELGLIALNQGQRYEAKNYFLEASSSKTDVGKNALISYAQLDLPDNPEKYIKIRRKENEGKKAIFKVINDSPLSVHNIVLTASFINKKGKVRKLPHEIEYVLHPNDQITLVIDHKVVPVKFQDSLELELVSVEVL